MSLIHSKRVVVRNADVKSCDDGSKDLLIAGKRFAMTADIGGPQSLKFHAEEVDGNRRAVITFDPEGSVHEIDTIDDWSV